MARPRRPANKKWRRALIATLALVMSAAAVLAVVQVFMYAKWHIEVVVPLVQLAPGSDHCKWAGGYHYQAQVLDNGENAIVTLPLWRTRRQLIGDLLRIQNGGENTENLKVSVDAGSFVYENAGPDASSDIDNLTVYIGGENITYTMTMGLGGALSFAPSQPVAVLLSVENGVPTYDNWSGTIQGGGTWRSFPIYADLRSGFTPGDNIKFSMTVVHESGSS